MASGDGPVVQSVPVPSITEIGTIHPIFNAGECALMQTRLKFLNPIAKKSGCMPISAYQESGQQSMTLPSVKKFGMRWFVWKTHNSINYKILLENRKVTSQPSSAYTKE